MPLVGLLAVYGVVHLLALFVLRSSGVYAELFGGDHLILHADDDRLSRDSGEWIDNHEFWDLPDEGEANEFWDDTQHDEAVGGHLRAVDF